MTGQASSGDRPWSIVLASREVWPFVEGGGIGRYIWTAARALAQRAEVSILTSSSWREHHDELARTADPRLPAGVRFAFVDEPSGDLSPFVSWSHLWSLRLVESAARLHPGGGPDILEIPDYQAEGFAAAHARRGLDPRLNRTTLAIGLHTSAEMCAAFDEQPQDAHMQVLSGLERFALRFADVLLWPGGNSLERYADFYGGDSLAPAVHRPLPAPVDLPTPAPLEESPESGPLRLLFLSRFQALKGIVELITAMRSLPEADLTLTVVGRDTMTGPGRSSMRAHVEELASGDRRIELRDQVPHAEVAPLIARHHAVIVPSRWESAPYVVREALACNRPVIATPVGWIPEAVRSGQSGWLARSGSAEDLAAVLLDALAERDMLAGMIDKGLPRAVFEEDAADDRTVEAYEEVLAAGARAPTGQRPARPHVDALVWCHAGGGDPATTLASLEAQADVSVDPVLVVGASGAFPGPGPALARSPVVILASNGDNGAGGALVAGLGRGSAELVLLVPAGAVLEPGFLSRAVAALSEEPGLAWVTSFVREGGTPAVAPLGTYALPAAEVDKPISIALVRRSALQGLRHDLRSPWEALPAALARAGAHGLVLQESFVSNLPRPAVVSLETSAPG